MHCHHPQTSAHRHRLSLLEPPKVPARLHPQSLGLFGQELARVGGQLRDVARHCTKPALHPYHADALLWAAARTQLRLIGAGPLAGTVSRSVLLATIPYRARIRVSGGGHGIGTEEDGSDRDKRVLVHCWAPDASRVAFLLRLQLPANVPCQWHNAGTGLSW